MLAIPVASPGGLVTMVCTIIRDGVSLSADDPFVLT